MTESSHQSQSAHPKVARQCAAQPTGQSAERPFRSDPAANQATTQTVVSDQPIAPAAGQETASPSRLKRAVEPKRISHWMELFLSGVLFVLGGILSVLLLMNTWSLIQIVIRTHEITSSELLGSIVTWFLYFEFLALIAKYYQSGLHFPLRYFIYIGITAIIRLIIIYHEDPLDTLLFSVSILVLLAALYLANTKLLKRE